MILNIFSHYYHFMMLYFLHCTLGQEKSRLLVVLMLIIFLLVGGSILDTNVGINCFQLKISVTLRLATSYLPCPQDVQGTTL